jgi:hypothetical protein
MGGVEAGLVEEDVAEPAADDGAEHAVEEQVLDVATVQPRDSNCGRRARRAARKRNRPKPTR